MAIDNFIPAVWASRLLENLRKAHVYGQAGVINRDYQGDITQMGDSVKINSIGAITIGDYTKNTNMSAAQTLTDAQSVLTINKAKYFNFQVDAIDAAQQNPKIMDAAMREAAYGLADAMDQDVAALYADAASGNLIGSTGSPKTDAATAGKPYQYLAELRQKLSEANVPDDGQRWVIIPPWYETYLLQDSKFVSAGTPSTDMVLQNGQIKSVLGMRVLVSNNVPYAAGPIKYRVVAGHPMAWTLAAQINSVEAYKMELRFGQAVKGLMLYGCKVTRASALAVLTINPT